MANDITLRQAIEEIVKDSGEISVRLVKVWDNVGCLVDVKEALERQDELKVHNWRTEYDSDWDEITVEVILA